MNWIKLSERSPQVEQRILFYSENLGIRMGYRMVSIANNPKKPQRLKFQVYGTLIKRTDVTHWMPLPEPPL